MNLSRNIILEIDLNTGHISTTANNYFYNTDRNIAYFYIKLYRTNVAGEKQYIGDTDSSQYKVYITAIKPKTITPVKLLGERITNSDVDDNVVYKIIIPNELMKQQGFVYCEGQVIYNNQELTTDCFSFKVNPDKFTEYNFTLITDPDLPILQDLINQIKHNVRGIDDNKISDSTVWSSEYTNAKFNAVDEQIKDKANFSQMKYKYLEKECLICVTYDNEEKRNYKLMITFDGVTFNKIDDLELEGWDYCLANHNGYYYLSYDYMSPDFNPSSYPYFTGADKIAILKTKDFVTYDKIDVQLPSFFKQAFGPELFFKGDKLHMFFSGCNLTDTTTDSEGVGQYIKHTYHTVSTDDGLTWSNPIEINLLNNENVVDKGNKIDPAIIENSGKYYLFLKNEHGKFIEEYESETIDGDYKLINNLNDRYFVEAPAVCYFNGIYYLYCDMYATGKYVYYTSSDLKNWSKSNILSITGNEVMRHFTPCKVYNNQLLKDIVKKNGYDPLIDDYKTSNDNNMFICNLENKTYECLSVKPNAIYRLTGVNNCIINTLDISNLNKGDRCYFLIATDYASLILKNNTQGVYLQDTEVILNKTTKCHNRLIEFICVDVQPTLCVLNHSDVNEFIKNSTTTFSEELTDSTTSIKATFSKRNQIAQANFVCQLTKDVDVGLYTMSFKAPFLPYSDVYNTTFTGYNENGDLQFRSVKIYFNGTIEVRTTTPIKSGQYFEGSVTYISK